jgi:cobalt/nickel transport system permease protein
MHLPDGFLSPLVAGVGWLLAVVILARAVRTTQQELGPRQVPLMGVLAAFIFAAQAINFPIMAGTSGHLIGGALVAIVVGPWAGSLAMTAVVVLQAVLFQDGGLLVMGWNIVNLAILSTFVGWTVYRLSCRLLGDSWQGRVMGAFTGAWLSVVVGAMATSVELALSGTYPLQVGLPAMAGVHALIGLVEGAVTLATLGFLATVRPSVLAQGKGKEGEKSVMVVSAGLLISLFVAMLSPLAATEPDGLEALAERAGFANQALPPAMELFPDYTIPLLSNSILTTLVAVGLGTVLVFLVGLALGRLLRNPTRV